MHKSWGNNPICFWTLVVFNWFLIPLTCLLGRQTFFVLVPCAIMKSEEGLFIPWWYFHHLVLCFHLLSFQSGIFNHVLVWVFDRIWTTLYLVTLVCVLSWFVWCFVQIVSHLVLESLVHAYLLYVYLMACLLLLTQYIW